jgi:hypothetical protein
MANPSSDLAAMAPAINRACLCAPRGRVLYPLAEVEQYEKANTITHDQP